MTTTITAVATIKVAQISKPGGDFEIVEREIPKPAQGHVRIEVPACGTCHSEVFTKEGWPGIQYHRIPGHEAVGSGAVTLRRSYDFQLTHAKTQLRMMSRSRIPAFDAIAPPSPADALPVLAFTHSHSVELNGEVTKPKRYTLAHSDTDISVFFAQATVLHTDDTWFNGHYPFNDYDSGGSVQGRITASSENLSLMDNDAIAVPGHGAVGRRHDLAEFHQILNAVYDCVASLKRPTIR